MPSPSLQQIAITLINGEQCWDRVKDLAVELTNGAPDEPVSVFWIANGAMFFAADLIREMAFRNKCLKIGVICGRSYDGTTSADLQHDTEMIDLKQHRGRRVVYVLDDCLDTGNTLHHVCAVLRKRLPDSRILPVAFVVKVGCQKFEVPLHAHGFKIHKNPWLLGYGLDDDGTHRAEPGLWAKIMNGWPRQADDIPIYVNDQPLKAWIESRRVRKK